MVSTISIALCSALLLIAVIGCKGSDHAPGPEPGSAVPSAAALQTHWDTGVAGEFQGVDGIPIRYRTFADAAHKAAIVISSGRTECMLKYQEVIYDLNRAGYSVYIHDHRGQGLSGRMLDDKEIGHVVKFSHYVTDLKTFVDQVVSPNEKALPAPANARPRLLLAHSMGGCIASLYVEEHTGDFKAVALCSPMHQPGTGMLPEFVAKLVTGDMKEWLGKKEKNSGDGYRDVPFDQIEADDRRGKAMTHSAERYERTRAAYAKHGVGLGGPSYGWAHEALDAATTARKNAARIEIPILLLQATEDAAVTADGQNEFAKNARDCRLIKIENAFHELLVESDRYRQPAMKEILAFFETAVGG